MTSPEEPARPFRPYVPADESPPEFTLKASIVGILFGIVFGAANAYLGLRAGLTISTSIPIAVMTVATFRLLAAAGRKSSILEANLAQTIGSASSSVASGVIFTLPALFLWHLDPSLLQMTLLALCGGLLGVLFMIPLRRFLIQKEHGKLPYPEGTACAEVLKASQTGGAEARNVFTGLGAGALLKFLTGGLKVLPGEIHANVPLLPRAQLGMDVSGALLGVGYILGPRVGAIMVGGGLLSSLVIIPIVAAWGADRATPLFPETVALIRDMSAGELWSSYVRYIGAGAVAAGGLITLARSIPTMIESFRIGSQQLKARVRGEGAEEEPRTGQDLSFRTVIPLVLTIALAMGFVPAVFQQIEHPVARVTAAFLVVLCAFFFVTVSSRIVGLVGVTSNPTSGMTIASLLLTASVFLLFGWTGDEGKAAALTVGCVVAIAASIAGDTSQDLKTGYLLGATPRRQQIGELVGVLTSATFVCLTVILLAETYGFGSKEIPAPQANLMKVVIEGVLDQSLPWSLVLIGAGIAVVVELLRIPSLPFAVGVYLPVSTMTPVFVGGVLRWWLQRRAAAEQRDEVEARGVLFGSGLVGGEGLVGVAFAGYAFLAKEKPAGLDLGLSETQFTGLGVAGVVLLLLAFVRACRVRAAARS